MGTIKVTVGNRYLNGVHETFLCTNVDISDIDEMENAAEECVGAFVDMYHYFFEYETQDITYDTKYEACYYTIEEVPTNV